MEILRPLAGILCAVDAVGRLVSGASSYLVPPKEMRVKVWESNPD